MSTLTDRLYKLHDRLRTLSHDLAESGDATKALPSEKRAEEAQACLEAARLLTWNPIESAPYNTPVLLYCPERGVANRERIELDYACQGNNGTRSYHSWATHWMPLPQPPATAEQVIRFNVGEAVV